jgi:single-strand DNA-binding protein
MRSLNNVVIAGNVVADPETRTTPTDQTVTVLRIALNRSYKDKEGEWQEQTDFIDVETWGTTAEQAAERLTKGSPVLVQGEIRTNSWQAEDGTNRTKTFVKADKLIFIDKPQN